MSARPSRPRPLRRHWPWLLAWLALSLLGALLLSRAELGRLREDFDTDARIAHRLMSQRVVQHDAIMATLALLQPADDGSQPERRLSSVYPQILTVQRRAQGESWPEGPLRVAETVSRAVHRPALATVDLARGRYTLVLASEPSSYALEMDLRGTVPWTEWPMAPDTSPVRITLQHEGQQYVIQPGDVRSGGWRFEAHKHLASASQPFDLVAMRSVGPGALPWARMAAVSAMAAAALLALWALQRQRAARLRAEELLRLGQVARLNTLGELAAGMAHELNQPLTAILANTQAASRLLAEEPPDVDIARQAMGQAVEQARRASTVVARLRRAVERPDLGAALQPVDLLDAVSNALYLLEPEFTRREVRAAVHPSAAPVWVQADPVALEQIIHNLLMNALQAMEQMPSGQRQLDASIAAFGGQGVLAIADSGRGIATDLLPRVFEPFFSTREGGLGLGLSLCETLATSMGGGLSAAANTPHGAVFTLTLVRVAAAPAPEA